MASTSQTDHNVATKGIKVAVMGAGAVGCYYGGMLARAGHEVVLIARPAKGGGVRHHIGNQPAGITGFERLHVAHDQAHPGAGRHLRAQGTQAVAEDHSATWAARRVGSTGNKGLTKARQARQTLLAQSGHRMAYAAR